MLDFMNLRQLTYCDDPLPAYTENLCAIYESRVIAVAFIRNDATITDYTDAAQWTAAIAAGQAVVIRNIRGSKAKGTAVKSPGFGRTKEKITGRDYVLNFFDPAVCENIDFYNALNKDKAHRVAYYTQATKLFVEESNTCLVDADTDITEELSDQTTINAEVTWSNIDLQQCYDGPASIFEADA